jgi:16S rRNA (guanine966-N2)-methyltransferase
MRVIAGEFRSRKIKSVPGMETRPTPDRLREALFNILDPRIQGATFLDLYAGCGSVAIEALSRGARTATLVERNRAALAVIRENLESLGLTARAHVVQANAHMAAGTHSADVVFMDPPYTMDREYQSALDALGARPPALAVVQHSSRLKLEDRYGKLRRVRTLSQGDNRLTFFEPDGADG